MPYFTVKYYAGTYSGTRSVRANDEQEAKDKVKAWVRREMTIPMYSDGYTVVSESDEEEDD